MKVEVSIIVIGSRVQVGVTVSLNVSNSTYGVSVTVLVLVIVMGQMSPLGVTVSVNVS